MTSLPLPCPSDPFIIATEVRTLASDAHRLLNDPASTAGDIEAVIGRIGCTERRIHGRFDASLSRWLASARLRLEGRRARKVAG